ncbi:MAG: flagellar biosynthesis protein FlhB [Spirochaetes bacterium]|nr:flagellar biosynthesis protein FlhB [Spirochaetota bacterium]
MFYENFINYEIIPGTDLPDFKFDLQLFAAEDEGRTEEPTEKKIREAREKGQVAKTEELPAALVVLCGFLTVFFLGKWTYDRIAKLAVYYFSNFAHINFDNRLLFKDGVRIMEEVAFILGPIFAVCIIVALMGNIMQVGFQASAHPIRFDLTKIKITPDEMMKKIFFSRKVAMNLFKSIFKILIIAISSYLIIHGDFDKIIAMPDISIAAAMSQLAFIALKIILWSAILLIALAIPDYFFQKSEFRESLKMSKQEVKEELKETMGDPQMRGRLREMQRQILTRNMIRAVPGADVVVTNPTHFAVALKWDQESDIPAPAVVAKGVDSMALRIKEIAKENDIFMIENRPLAQELYKRLDIGDIIPEDLFKAVSEVYSILYQKGKLKYVG